MFAYDHAIGGQPTERALDRAETHVDRLSDALFRRHLVARPPRTCSDRVQNSALQAGVFGQATLVRHPIEFPKRVERGLVGRGGLESCIFIVAWPFDVVQ